MKRLLCLLTHHDPNLNNLAIVDGTAVSKCRRCKSPIRKNRQGLWKKQ